MTHTKGPWRIGSTRRDDNEDEDMAYLEICGPTPGPIIGECWKLNSDEDEMVANARLIAAAPALLEALRATQEFIRVVPQEVLDMLEDAYPHEQVIQALAAAEGRGV